MQKSGTCVGSAVAPVLCDIFLSSVSKRIASQLGEFDVTKAFRYVDDNLLILKDVNGLPINNSVAGIVKLFEASGQSLRFTWEMALDNAIKFFDIRITFKVDNLCWFYSPRAKKCLLPYESVLSELIKRGIAMACLKAALDKSGHHEMLKVFAGSSKVLPQPSTLTHFSLMSASLFCRR